MFELLGDPSDAARAEADAVFAFETKLAKASRTRVEMRDPQKNYNKRSLADLAKEAPGFDWKAYLVAVGIPEGQELNVRQPEFFRAYAEMASAEPLATWKTYLKWHILHGSANPPSEAVRRGELRLLRPDPARRPAAGGAVEARPRGDRPGDRRGAGPALRREGLQPEVEGADDASSSRTCAPP